MSARSSRSRNASPLRSSFGNPSYTVSNMSVADELHPVLHAGRVAVITGAASGIGRAAAKELARLGLKIAIADANEESLNALGRELVETIGAQNVLIVPTDVSKLDQVTRLKDKVYDTWGEVHAFSGFFGRRFQRIDRGS